jgi:hypothetical protein
VRAWWIEIVALSTAVLIIALTLFVPPPVGVADDGDFPRVLRVFNLVPANEPCCFENIVVHYRFDPAAHWWGGFPSSETLLMFPALALNRLISRPGEFDLRAMGAVHAGLLLAALALYLSVTHRLASIGRAVAAAAAIFVFCDTLYLSYLNSFYMDTPALLFLLLSAAFYLRIAGAKNPRTADWIGFVAGSFLFATAKSQHSLAALPIAAILFWKGHRRTAVVLSTVSLLFILQAPFDYSATARFNLIFHRIVPEAPDRARALAELGLDNSYASKIGLHSYAADSQMTDLDWVHRFDERATYSRLFRYYLWHPLVPLEMLGAGLNDAGFQRIRLGNFPRSAGKPRAAQSNSFAAWTLLKQAIFTSRGWLYAIYSAALCALLPLLARRHPQWFAGALALVAITLVTLAIGCLGDGLDYLRHLFLFNACLDMLALGCCVAMNANLAADGHR